MAWPRGLERREGGKEGKFVSGSAGLKVGREVAGEWRSPWDSRLLSHLLVIVAFVIHQTVSIPNLYIKAFISGVIVAEDRVSRRP